MVVPSPHLPYLKLRYRQLFCQKNGSTAVLLYAMPRHAQTRFDLRRKHLVCLHNVCGSRSVLSALDARDCASFCFLCAYRLILYP